jgi:hypothetical protein
MYSLKNMTGNDFKNHTQKALTLEAEGTTASYEWEEELGKPVLPEFSLLCKSEVNPCFVF